jgi:phosphatidylserine/phosphatidylglycerophosphate/cardiolipin synthase-like enzyme
VADGNQRPLARAARLAQKARQGIGVAAGHAIGRTVDRVVVDHHVRRLRKVGWGHAFDAPAGGWADGGMPPREGNSVEVLIDGAEFLPLAAEELAKAQSHVHMTGWYFSPELALTRDEDPVTVRNLLAELAERIPVRVLIWSGAPVRVFSPTRGDVQDMVERFCRGTKITCEFDNCVRFWHCHHEKTIVIDDRVAFVGGSDLTYDGGDPYDSPEHKARGGVGWHDIATRLRGPIVADVAEHFRLRWHGTTDEALASPAAPEPAGDLTVQLVRTIPESIYEQNLPRGDFSVLESYVRAIRSAERFIYIENQFLWSPEIVELLAEKLRNPPRDDFRIVVLLPVNANDGADVSRGQVAALIHADDDHGRFLACSVYARVGTLHDPVYVHAKIAIVDDRWLTVGSANLNEHSLFNDSEVNVVVQDEELAGQTRLRLWSEHLELPIDEIRDESPAETFDRHWVPIAEGQLERLRDDVHLTHRLVLLPGVSVKHRRILGALEGRLYDA